MTAVSAVIFLISARHNLPTTQIMAQAMQEGLEWHVLILQY